MIRTWGWLMPKSTLESPSAPQSLLGGRKAGLWGLGPLTGRVHAVVPEPCLSQGRKGNRGSFQIVAESFSRGPAILVLGSLP